ncbi:MAG: amidohydrolase family protein [Planctomycetes bacterium]|nr:amidohydrolase family protein [Planctomycetota bacterium]
MIIKARFVAPVGGPVIENGAVEIADGRIVSVGPARSVGAASAVDFGDAVILPGFVNAHTHLELGALAGQVPPGDDLIVWLKRLVEALRTTPPTQKSVADAVRSGLAELIRAGVTTVGDVTAHPRWSRPLLAGASVRGVSFGEVIAIGTTRGALAARLDNAASIDDVTDRLRVGISPHAPYSVEPVGLRACADRAAQMGTRVCIHLAESPHEAEFTKHGTGPFRDYLRALGVFDDRVTVAGCSPVRAAHAAGLLTERTIIAHANYVTAADIAVIAAAGASVAYCPRTHAAFGHSPHPFRRMAAAGVNVCVGTDSLASNPSLSILDELRFIRSIRPDLPAEELIAMGTVNGARALGVDGHTGTLAPGMAADVVVLALAANAGVTMWGGILDSATAPIAVYLDGTWLRPEMDRPSSGE